MRWDDVGAWGILGDSQEASTRFSGKLPHIPQLRWSYPGILEDPSRRVPASGPLLPPTYAHRRRGYWCSGPVSREQRWFWPSVAQCKGADRNITSLVCAFSRHFLSGDGWDALLLSTVLSFYHVDRRTDGRTDWTRAKRRGHILPSEGSRRDNADQAPRPLRLESWGHHPMGPPKTGPLSARLDSYTIRTFRDALEHTPR